MLSLIKLILTHIVLVRHMWRKSGRNTIKFTEYGADPTALITEARRSILLYSIAHTQHESVHRWKGNQQHSLDKYFHKNWSTGS
jgi:hypothetical protein